VLAALLPGGGRRRTAAQATATVVCRPGCLGEGSTSKGRVPCAASPRRRNLWGLRATAVVFAVVSLVATAAWVAFSGPWV
jgi:hypothetical protein